MLSMMGRIGHWTAPSGILDFDQVDVIYAGPDRSFDCAIRAFRFDHLDVSYAGPDRLFDCAIQAFRFDQLDVIYAGPDMSFY